MAGYIVEGLKDGWTTVYGPCSRDRAMGFIDAISRVNPRPPTRVLRLLGGEPMETVLELPGAAPALCVPSSAAPYEGNDTSDLLKHLLAKHQYNERMEALRAAEHDLHEGSAAATLRELKGLLSGASSVEDVDEKTMSVIFLRLKPFPG